MNDYSQHLDATYLQLQHIHDAAKQGNTGKVSEIAQAVDWEAVAGEFESVACAITEPFTGTTGESSAIYYCLTFPTTTA